MSNFKKSAIAATTLALLSTSVLAQDLNKWAGNHVGLTAGWATGSTQLRINESNNDFFPDFGGGETSKQKPDGGFGGVEFGKLAQNGKLVYGGFGSVMFSTAKDIFWSTDACCGSGDDQLKTRYKQVGILGGKLGLAQDRALMYVKAGLSLGKVNFSILDDNTRADGSDSSDSTGKKSISKTIPGIALGAGIDYRLDKNWALGLDYTYLNLGSKTWDVSTSSYNSSGAYRGEAQYVVTTKGLHQQFVGFSLKYIFD